MEQSKQERVVELIREKINLEEDLESINIKGYSFIVGYETECKMFLSNLSSVSQSFLAEIKKLTEEHLQQRIEEIDNELKEL